MPWAFILSDYTVRLFTCRLFLVRQLPRIHERGEIGPRHRGDSALVDTGGYCAPLLLALPRTEGLRDSTRESVAPTATTIPSV